jgi:hypothetical protein
MPNKYEVNWLSLEADIRKILKEADNTPPTDNGEVDAEVLAYLLMEISDALGNYTGRGYVLEEKWARQWETSLDGK